MNNKKTLRDMIPAILIDMHYMVYRSYHIERITSAFTKNQWLKIKTINLAEDSDDSDIEFELDITDASSSSPDVRGKLYPHFQTSSEDRRRRIIRNRRFRLSIQG